MLIDLVHDKEWLNVFEELGAIIRSEELQLEMLREGKPVFLLKWVDWRRWWGFVD